MGFEILNGRVAVRRQRRTDEINIGYFPSKTNIPSFSPIRRLYEPEANVPAFPPGRMPYPLSEL